MLQATDKEIYLYLSQLTFDIENNKTERNI